MSKKVIHSQEQGQTAQVFGGPWSLIKTDVVEEYLQFFSTALKRQGFKRIYVDAFAGSGAFKYIKSSNERTLFDQIDEADHIHKGSAQRALNVDPPFDELVFIEQDVSNIQALKELIAKSKHPNVRLKEGDANEVLQSLCKQRDWNTTRGVVFLDPFGMHVEWETLKQIANTKAFDTWYLFALGGTVRNLPWLASKLDQSKRLAVTRVLGTEEWFDKFYRPSKNETLFDSSPLPKILRRSVTVDEIESYVREWLLTIFPLVEPPLRLKAPKNKPLFSLFFAVSNPGKKAKALAQKGASHILKMR